MFRFTQFFEVDFKSISNPGYLGINIFACRSTSGENKSFDYNLGIASKACEYQSSNEPWKLVLILYSHM
jgi:hypothetical protein